MKISELALLFFSLKSSCTFGSLEDEIATSTTKRNNVRHHHRNLAEYKYYADMECQPSFCENFRDTCKVTSMTGSSQISFSSSYCHVDMIGDVELTCTEECVAPAPTPTPPAPIAPSGPEYKYYDDLECQPSFCQNFSDKCQLTAGAGTANISFSPTSCSVDLNGNVELTCTEECITPAPAPTPSGPQYTYTEDLVCQTTFCQNFPSKCSLSGAGFYSIQFSGNTCSVDLTGNVTLTCNEECVTPPPPTGPQYTYTEDLVCQPDMCIDFADKCYLSGSGGYTIKGGFSTCEVDLQGNVVLTCNEECVTPGTASIKQQTSTSSIAKQGREKQVTGVVKVSAHHKPTSSSSIVAPQEGEYIYTSNIECQPDFCVDWSSTCKVDSDHMAEGGAFASYGPTYCRITIMGDSTRLICNEECRPPTPDVPPSHDFLPTGIFQITEVQNPGYCFDIASAEKGSDVFQTLCDGSPTQQWTLQELYNEKGNPVFTIRSSLNSELCIDVERSSGNNVHLWECKNSNSFNQEFDTNFYETTGKLLTTLLSGEICIDVTDVSIDADIFGVQGAAGISKTQCADSADISLFEFK